MQIYDYNSVKLSSGKLDIEDNTSSDDDSCSSDGREFLLPVPYSKWVKYACL